MLKIQVGANQRGLLIEYETVYTKIPKILDHWVMENNKRNTKTKFLIHWKGKVKKMQFGNDGKTTLGTTCDDRCMAPKWRGVQTVAWNKQWYDTNIGMTQPVAWRRQWHNIGSGMAQTRQGSGLKA